MKQNTLASFPESHKLHRSRLISLFVCVFGSSFAAHDYSHTLLPKSSNFSNKIFSTDAIVGIKARPWIGRFGYSNFGNFFFKSQEPLWGPQAITNEISSGVRSGVKQPGPEVDHSPSLSSGVGNEWS
jgi:hypothetical protein